MRLKFIHLVAILLLFLMKRKFSGSDGFTGCIPTSWHTYKCSVCSRRGSNLASIQTHIVASKRNGGACAVAVPQLGEADISNARSRIGGTVKYDPVC